MMATDSTEQGSTPTPHLCVLRPEEGESFGFDLSTGMKKHNGHVIRNVASGGVAQRSGLKGGDRILEVNNHYVDHLSCSEVARKIKQSGQQLCLLVLDGEVYERALSRGEDLQSLAKTYKGGDLKPPRLCHITKHPDSGLGIYFAPLEGEKGCFSVNVVAGGAAEKAGVLKGDHLVWINGAVVSHLTHSALTKMMKRCGNHITVMVIDSKSEMIYRQKKIPILPAMAVPHNLPFRARKLHLSRGVKGYGFVLRLERTVSGRTYHFLREMDSGGPAQEAGMKDGEILLEVNGESVESLTHTEIVDRVRLSGEKLSLTTISFPGLEFYTKLGLTPVLFCEDEATKKEEDKSVSAAAEQEEEEVSVL
ncbi:PDZ domain containing 3b isoform X1 [Oryzias melastigma]|uniref:PDZ domain containing 3b isoform X1 n=2 Tax=Oryzias melastigma TaxID=30732 RepID=UPI000CF82348|nr:PDZ domain containing 3b isoform X1 [Oryzias melastigma]